MKKFGVKLLSVVVTSSMIVTPVMAAPSVKDLKQNKKAAQKQNPSAKLSFLHDHIIPVQMILYKADTICLFRRSAYREILSQ